MSAWDENFDAMLKNREEEVKRSAERRAALTPRRRFRAEIERAAQRNRRGSIRAVNRAVSAAHRRRMAEYISRRNPNFRSLAALRTTAKKPFQKLPENIVTHIGSMLYGPRARGQGQILDEMARRAREHKIAAATRRHFPNLGLPKPTRRHSAPLKTRRFRPRSHSK